MRGTKRKIEHIPVKQEIKTSIHNRFDIEIIDAKTGEIKQKAYAENVICDSLWSRLLAPSSYFLYIHYGTGNGTPSASDTSLFSFLGYGTPNYAEDVRTQKPEEGWFSWQRKIQLSETTAVGSTITEVGIAYGTTAATLVTHAMLKDMNGNQISILKTSTDLINIYATVFVHYAALGFDSGSIHIIPYSGASRQSQGYLINGFLGALAGGYQSPGYEAGAVPPTVVSPTWLGCVYTTPSGDTYKAVTATYSVANKTITLTMTRMAVGDMNFGGLGGLIFWGHVYGDPASFYHPAMFFKVGGSWYPKTSISAEAVGTGDGNTVQFATDYPFPTNAKIYVNGTQVTSGVVVSALPISTDMSLYWSGVYGGILDSNGDGIPYPRIRNCSGNYGTLYYENLLCDTVGILSVYGRYFDLYVSNDMATWTQVVVNASSSQTYTIPEAYRKYRFWKAVSSSSLTSGPQTLLPTSEVTGYNILFDTAPASGDVITADYDTPTIAKDANYVFDLTVVISLAEKTV